MFVLYLKLSDCGWRFFQNLISGKQVIFENQTTIKNQSNKTLPMSQYTSLSDTYTLFGFILSRIFASWLEKVWRTSFKYLVFNALQLRYWYDFYCFASCATGESCVTKCTHDVHNLTRYQLFSILLNLIQNRTKTLLKCIISGALSDKGGEMSAMSKSSSHI